MLVAYLHQAVVLRGTTAEETGKLTMSVKVFEWQACAGAEDASLCEAWTAAVSAGTRFMHIARARLGARGEV